MITKNEIILNLIQTKGLGHKGLCLIFNGLFKHKLSLHDMLGMKSSDISHKFGINIDICNRLLDIHSNNLSKILEDNNVSIVTILDKSYPIRLKMTLGDLAPPILFIKGNIEILNAKSVGFCGARKASPKGLEVASLCADALVNENINISSGYAHGVDMRAHTSALSHGGTTTIVLAEGILNFRIKNDIKDVFDEKRSVIVSEFNPESRWFASNAMQRNKTILGLSKAMLVIEAAMKGGTYSAAMAAIKYRVPLFFADYKINNLTSEGNKYFLSKGANAIRANRHGEPNIDGVLKAVNRKEHFYIQKASQIYF